MRTLHWYLLRRVMATLLMSVGVFTGVLLLGNALKEVMMLLVHGQATAGAVLEAFSLLVPFVISFSLPMGLLMAMLLVFGRFSADQELVAARACGVSLVSLAGPVLLLAAVLSVLSAWINLEVAPRCRNQYKELIFRLAAHNPGALLTERAFITELKDQVIYIGKKTGGAAEGEWNLENVMLMRMHNKEPIQRTRAPRGRLVVDEKGKRYVFTLFEARTFMRRDRMEALAGPGGEEEEPLPELPPLIDGKNSAHDTNEFSLGTNVVVTNGIPGAGSEREKQEDSLDLGPQWQPMAVAESELVVPFRTLENRVYKSKLTHLTFRELQRELKRHGRVRELDPQTGHVLVHYGTAQPPEAGTEISVLRAGKEVGRVKISNLSSTQHLVGEVVWGEPQVGDRLDLDTMPMRVQLNRQVSFSFACLGFTLVSIPLGIRAHRRETTVGVALAVVLVVVYYSFIILGHALESRPEFRPELIVWAPALLFNLGGGWLLWRINQS